MTDARNRVTSADRYWEAVSGERASRSENRVVRTQGPRESKVETVKLVVAVKLHRQRVTKEGRRML